LQIVNGYLCQTCCDVALAKQGKNPAHPNAPAWQSDKTGQVGQSGNTNQAAGASSSSTNAPAVTFGGALAQANGGASSQAGSQQAGAPYSPGTVFSLMA
jgi:hypothetical protein